MRGTTFSHVNGVRPPIVVTAGSRSGTTGLAGCGRRQVLAVLVVVPHAEVDGEVAEGERVREIAAQILLTRLDHGLPRQHRDRRVEVGEVAVVAVARPGRDRRHVRRAVVEAELELLADLAGVEEVRAARRGLLLGPDRVGIEVAADELALLVDVEVVDVVAALGREREAARHRRVGRRRKERGREHLGDLAPPDRRRARLVPRSGWRAREADVASDLLLVAVAERAHQRRRIEELEVDLRVVVDERRVVRVALRVEQVDLVAARGAPRPEPVLPERTAELDAVVLHFVDAVAAVGHALRLVEGGDVVPLEARRRPGSTGPSRARRWCRAWSRGSTGRRASPP